MAKCTQCGAKTSFMMAMCDSCIADHEAKRKQNRPPPQRPPIRSLVASWYFARVYLGLFSLAGWKITGIVLSSGVEGNAAGRMIMALGAILTLPSSIAVVLLWSSNPHQATYYIASITLAAHVISFFILGVTAFPFAFLIGGILALLFFCFTFGSKSRALCGLRSLKSTKPK